jgi:hypothetical protein
MTASAEEVFEPSAYPRTYRLSVAGKWLLSVLGLVPLLFSFIGAVVFSPAASARVYMACAVLALLGIYLLATALFYGVILQADSIQVFEIYRRRYLARGDIEGRSHFSHGQGPSGWVLVPKPGFGGKMRLSAYLETDKAFLSWIRSLPDLDLGNKRVAEHEKREAIASLKQHGFAELTLRRAALGLNITVYGLGFASFIVRDPDHLLTWALVAMPWIAILLVAKFAPYYRFGGPRNSPLPDLSLMLVLPGLFLALSALQRIAPIGWTGPSLLTVFGSAVLVGVALWCDPWLKKHRGIAALLLFLCCSYGYGAGLEVNAMLDQSPPQSYRVVVAAKHVNQGKSTSYHLTLAPWGPYVSGQDLRVSHSRYAATRPGDTVCMFLRAGALHVAWSELGSCDELD